MPELDSVWYPTQLEVTRPYILKEYVFRELIRKEERWVTQAFLPVRLWLSNELEVRDLTMRGLWILVLSWRDLVNMAGSMGAPALLSVPI